jgi:hypothetical protein
MMLIMSSIIQQQGGRGKEEKKPDGKQVKGAGSSDGKRKR